MKRHAKKYISDIRKVFPRYGKQEKRYIQYLTSAVQEYDQQHPESTVEDLKKEFGTPVQVVADYWNELDYSELVKKMRLYERIRHILYSGIIIALAVWLLCCAFQYASYREALKHNVAYTEIYIESSDVD